MKYRQDLKRAESLLGKNRFPEARALCQRLCRQAPDDHRPWQLLGKIQLRENQPAAALQALQQAARLNSDASILKLLASAQCATGNHPGACATLQAVIRQDPSDPAAFLELGRILGQLGKYDQSAICFQQAARLQPDSFLAHAGLGNAQFMLGNMEPAISSYRQAAQLDARNIFVLCNLGMALSMVSRHDEALACFRRALAIKADAAEIHIVMANTLNATGAFEAALESFRNASNYRPGHVDAVAGEAGTLEKLGKYPEAHTVIRTLTTGQVEHVSVAIAYAAISRHFGEEQDACALIERLLARDNISAAQRQELHFAAGGLLDRLGEYDAAFAHFNSANALVPCTQYSRERDTLSFDTIINIFSSEFMRHARRSSNSSDKPVFIVGMPRSGTSLTEQILASHPQVFGAGELDRIQSIAEATGISAQVNTAAPGPIPEMSQQQMDLIAEQHVSFLASLAPDRRLVIDKMPHNFLHLGLIHLLFPGAHIIHCMRNPLDTCLSIYFQKFGSGNDYAYDLENLAAHYCNYWRLMQHWRSVGIPMLEVSYEELVSSQQETSRKIVAFCGLEWDERCLAFHASGRLTRTASYAQVRNPVYNRSVNRWRNYASHLAPLIERFAGAGII